MPSSTSWWGGKVRQFGRHVTGAVTPAERRDLSARLTRPQFLLFESMHPADQRHGLDVEAYLLAAGERDGDLLLAGLLHDAGKGRSVGVWHRVAWSLGERYGPRARGIAAHLPGFAGAFDLLERHAARSADLALQAGCSARTAELIRNQSAPVEPIAGEALRRADEAC